MKAVNHDEHECTDPHHRDARGNHLPRPPYHPVIAEEYSRRQPVYPLQSDTLEVHRKVTTMNDMYPGRIVHPNSYIKIKRRIYKDGPDRPYTSYKIILPKDRRASGTVRPCILYIQPGGPITGDAHYCDNQVIEWVAKLNIICVTINYRLAPEHDPSAALFDCMDVLDDIIDNKDFVEPHVSTSIDLTKMCVFSGEGGAVIAASFAVCLRDRERNLQSLRSNNNHQNDAANRALVPRADGAGKRKRADESHDEDSARTKKQRVDETGTSKSPQRTAATKALREFRNIKGLLLYSPMLDYRLKGVSAAQFRSGGPHDVALTKTTWSLFLEGKFDSTLGDAGYESGHELMVPGFWEDLDSMPATFIEVGSCETYRSEAVQFAEQMWYRGGDCELHVWPGGSSAFAQKFPALQISKSAIEARGMWLERILYGR